MAQNGNENDKARNGNPICDLCIGLTIYTRYFHIYIYIYILSYNTAYLYSSSLCSAMRDAEQNAKCLGLKLGVETEGEMNMEEFLHRDLSRDSKQRFDFLTPTQHAQLMVLLANHSVEKGDPRLTQIQERLEKELHQFAEYTLVPPKEDRFRFIYCGASVYSKYLLVQKGYLPLNVGFAVLSRERKPNNALAPRPDASSIITIEPRAVWDRTKEAFVFTGTAMYQFGQKQVDGFGQRYMNVRLSLYFF